MMGPDATGSEAKGCGPPIPPVSGGMSEARIDAVRDELNNLSRLNAALFRWVFSGESVEREFFAARFDKTDPVADGCDVSRGWDLRIEGDFYLVKRLHGAIYVIVGDATGHHAYAGGLKVFVAAALQRIFVDFDRDRQSPPAAKVLERLGAFFCEVGLAAITENPEQPLNDGADVVVVRIDLGPDRVVSYASAGLPVLALGADMAVPYSAFRNGKGVRFPATVTEAESQVPISRGTIAADGIDFLAFVTDGFHNLARKPRLGQDRGAAQVSQPEHFGEERVKAELAAALRHVRLKPPASRPAAIITEELVAAARDFRRGYGIPEHYDDDRMVVVVDLNAIWRESGGEQRLP